MASRAQALLGERMSRHGLADRPADTPLAATTRTTAVQAQDSVASRLGLRARATGLTDAGVLHAIDVERSLVRTWLMRATIHLVAADDLRWMLRLLGPSVERRYAKRWRELGLTPQVREKVNRVMAEFLATGPRTTREIKAHLLERGVLPEVPVPEVYPHTIVQASTTGLTCRGSDRGRTNTYVLLDDWLPDSPPGPSGDDALAELARRYFTAYSPATAADFTSWSGLPSGRAVELIRAELQPADVDGRPGFRMGEAPVHGGVRLLPAFDNYLIGYRHRAALLDPSLHPHVYQGGWIKPVVLRDGAVLGTWALDRRAARVTVAPFAPLPAVVQRAVAAEVRDIARFLDLELELDIAAP